MDHDAARLLASAVADGEAARTPDLDAHLATCAGCAAYAAGLGRLSVLTAALPREPAPAALPAAVRARVGRARRRRWALRLGTPLVAAATALLVVVASPSGVPLTPLPPAAAAEPLLRLRSLYVERTVTTRGGALGEAVKERIWWRAPGDVRIERDGAVTIWTPELTYAGGTVTVHAAPSITLPEPLSPTVALLGRDTGPGPVVAGRPTRTYRLAFGADARTAHVAAGVTVRGVETVVLSKLGGRTVKETQVVRIDEPIPDALFAPPPGAPRVDGRFAERPLDGLAVAPERRPEGFALVRAGRGPEGDAALFARGSLPVLVRTGGLTRPGVGEVRDVAHGGRTYLVRLDLYEPPEVQLTTRAGVVVTVSAPLPPASLVALATAMYGVE